MLSIRTKTAKPSPKTGKMPTQKPGDKFNTMRCYVRHVTIIRHRLLVLRRTETDILHPRVNREGIVVPHNDAVGLLHQIHQNQIFVAHLSIN